MLSNDFSARFLRLLSPPVVSRIRGLIASGDSG
jgi:hypothetical protein